MKLFGRSIIAGYPKNFFNRNTALFLNGFLLATLIFFYIEDTYEHQLFKSLASYVEKGILIKTRDSVLIRSLHLTHELGASRGAIFNQPINSVKSTLIHPVTFDLMTAKSACGSYAFILSRLLTELKIPNRIAQMMVNGEYGGHILVEAKTEEGWAVLDPLYNLCFRKPDGNLAGFSEVHNNWNYYVHQVPASYNEAYRYESVRYTNWQKVPILMPLLKNIFIFFIGKERTDTFSLRPFLLRKFHLLFQVIGIIYIPFSLITIRRYIY